MDEKISKLESAIENHEKRLHVLESILAKPKQLRSKTNKTSLSSHIMNLRDNNFFAQAKTAAETHEKLHATYHCERDRVAMALLRLADSKQLRKASKIVGKKKFKAYVW